MALSLPDSSCCFHLRMTLPGDVRYADVADPDTECDAMTEYALVADLGGTRTRVALADRAGKVHHRVVAPTDAHTGREAVVARLLTALQGVASQVRREQLVGVGVSLAGPTDPQTGKMHNPPNLPGWDGYSLKPFLRERLSLEASFGNDANLAALAEHTHGAGRPYSHMVYMTLSTGIGGGVILDGRLYTGAHGYAGEVGHITIDRNGPVCNCGNVGCLEAMASGTAVARMAAERIASGEAAGFPGSKASAPDARAVFEAARSGDSVAKSIVREVSTNLGVGIVSLLHAFDPEAIVVGGGMSENLNLLLPGVDREIELHAMAHQRRGIPIVKSELGDDVGLIGAAVLAFEAYDGGVWSA